MHWDRFESPPLPAFPIFHVLCLHLQVQVLVDMVAEGILAMAATAAMVGTVTWAMGKVTDLAMVEDMAVVATVVAMAATLLPANTGLIAQPTRVATLHPLPQVTLMLLMV